MKLTARKNPKSDKYDHLRFQRADGSSTETHMPRQGILPHDLLHYIVESTLPFQFGFLRQVADGADAAFVMEQIHDVSNAKVGIEAVQVEAIVEALQTQLWAGEFDQEMFTYAAEMACSARNTAAYVFQEIDLKLSLFDTAKTLGEHWQKVPAGGVFELEFR